MREAIDRTIGVVDETGTVIACSELGLIGEVRKGVVSSGVFGTTQTCVDNATYTTFDVLVRPEYAVFVDGTDELAHHYSALIAVALDQIKQNNDEKFDRSNFVKNVILDNILPGDIYIKSRELHFNNDASRVVFLIRTTQETEISVFDIIQNFFPDKSKDFVINVNESDIALVKEVRPNVDIKDLEKLARSINDTLLSEFYFNAVIGIGTCVTGIKELAHSFKEAQVALEVGKVFDTEKTIISYENLGIARLIYQLPTIRELLKRCGIDRTVTILDTHGYNTVQKPLYEVATSHTARKTFVGNLYRQVPDPNLIASMSGHVEGSRAFNRYRTIDDDMKRRLVDMID